MPIELELAIALPCVLWVLFHLALPAGPYEMDHGLGANRGTFFPLLILYNAFFLSVAVADGFAAAWGWDHARGPALGFLLASGVYALLFNGFQVFWYEDYLASKTQGHSSNYTIGRYALAMALGVSSMVLMVVGLAVMAAGAR